MLTLKELAPLVGYEAWQFDVDPSETRGWDNLYQEDGPYFWYPYDVAARLVREIGITGTILDHGCGAGNHLEFFTRLGLHPIGMDVSLNALNIVRQRFRGVMLPCPPLRLLDPTRPLATQLPYFDHAFAWWSLCYSPNIAEDIAAIIAKLPANGAFIMALPTVNDVSFKESAPLANGRRRILSDRSGQHGMELTIPENVEEIARWCAGIDIRENGLCGWTIGGVRSEFHVIYGTKT